jgi:hypothetical protein
VFDVLVGMSQGKRPLGRLRRGWEDGIKIEGPVAGCCEDADEMSGSGAME